VIPFEDQKCIYNKVIWRKKMLLLTRRIGESLMIGDDVTVMVLGVKGNQVRIGVNAPKDVPVHREEIYQRIQNEKPVQVNTTPPTYTKPAGLNRQTLTRKPETTES